MNKIKQNRNSHVVHLSYTMWVILNYINSILIAKMFPKTIRSKYEKLIMLLKFMNRN